MFSFLFEFGAWFLRKAAIALLIVALAVTALATSLFLRDTTNLDTQRTRRAEDLARQRDAVLEERLEIERRVEGLRVDLRAHDDRIQRAGRIIETLESLQSRWERWFGDTAQQRSNDAQIERMRAIQAEARQEKLEFQRTLTEAAWRREALEQQLSPLEGEIEALQQSPSAIVHYLTQAWVRSRGWVAAGVFLYFFGSWILRIVLYFGVAPFVARGKTIRLAPEPQALPEVSSREGSIHVSLWPGEILVVRSKYLAESTDAVNRRNRPLLDWSLPLTSFVSGLFSVAELHNRHVGGEHPVLLARTDHPDAVFAVAQISEGSSLILRPRFLAGVIHQAGHPVVIRSRWRLFNRQYWDTFQFRYMEFVGPCRLIVAAGHGLRVEQLVARDVGPKPIRRVAPLAAIGFTPNLDCALVRTERFWRYLRGLDPLIEMCFAGPGLVLAGDPNDTAAGRFSRFWSSRWNRLLRVIGA